MNTGHCEIGNVRLDRGIAQLAFRPFLYFAIFVFGAQQALAQSLQPSAFTKLTFEQKLDAKLDLSLAFKDERGRSVTLSDYFGRKPVILDMGYYECPMLCSLVMNGLVEGLKEIQPPNTGGFEVVCVSISPAEGPALADAKKRNYMRLYNRPGADADWHFLTGKEPAIHALAEQVGFQYAYDPSIKQYAHPSGLVIITPEGRVSRYFFGVTYPPDQLKAALAQASAGRPGSPIKQLLILCFEHLPLIGKYSGSVMMAVRAGALMVLVAMIAGFVLMIRRGRKCEAPSGRPKQEVNPS